MFGSASRHVRKVLSGTRFGCGGANFALSSYSLDRIVMDTSLREARLREIPKPRTPFCLENLELRHCLEESILPVVLNRSRN